MNRQHTSLAGIGLFLSVAAMMVASTGFSQSAFSQTAAAVEVYELAVADVDAVTVEVEVEATDAATCDKADGSCDKADGSCGEDCGEDCTKCNKTKKAGFTTGEVAEKKISNLPARSASCFAVSYPLEVR